MTNDEIGDTLRQILDRLTAIETACGLCREDVAEHHIAIDGTNGTQGFKTRMRVVEIQQASDRKAIRRLYAIAWSAMVAVIAVAFCAGGICVRVSQCAERAVTASGSSR